MVIGIVVQKYFCNNLGVYALSYCAVDAVIRYCKKAKTPVEVRIFTDEHERVCEEVKRVFQYDGVKAFPIIKIRKPAAYMEYARHIAPCDIVLDTGLGDGFSDIYSSGKFVLQYFLKRIPEWKGCRTVLLPQTIGPYKKKQFERNAGAVIRNAAACFARDEASCSYAKKISGAENVILTTDMAMRLPRSSAQYEIPEGINVGLNVSGLLYMGGYTRSNQFHLKYDYSAFIDRLIERLAQKHCRVHLIAHVYRNNGEGDEFACRKLAEKYGDLIVAPEFPSPMDAKAYIAGMDFFIGSRMHSTIAAISSRVPVCPVGYSRKFNGLFETIGYSHYVDATKESMEDSIDKILSLLDRREQVKTDVEAAMTRADSLCDVFSAGLERVFDGAGKGSGESV